MSCQELRWDWISAINSFKRNCRAQLLFLICSSPAAGTAAWSPCPHDEVHFIPYLISENFFLTQRDYSWARQGLTCGVTIMFWCWVSLPFWIAAEIWESSRRNGVHHKRSCPAFFFSLIKEWRKKSEGRQKTFTESSFFGSPSRIPSL